MKNTIEAEIRGVLEKVGTEILNIYKAQAPKDTGALRNSIRYKIVKKGGSLALSFYYLKYGVFVDLGTYANADQSAYGVSSFSLPAWNRNPGRGGFGIRPRYWTSLRADASELQEYIEDQVKNIIGVSAQDIMAGIQSRTQRNTA
jgi:hypothetical protein